MSFSAEYESFLKRLNSIRTTAGICLGLSRIEKLLKKLGDPQSSFKSIVISGTNGKGSVVAMLSSVLKNAGYKVGSYISPHLYDIRERISVDSCWIDKGSLLRIGERILNLAESMSDSPSFYEVMTAIAFDYFREKRVDIAVLEIGLGGRLDAVNVVNPIHCIITTVDYDHESYLGNTLAEIAKEKAGIIKRGATVVLGERKEEVVEVINDICARREACLYKVGTDFDFKVVKVGSVVDESPIMDFLAGDTILRNIEIGLRGMYQFLNASLVVESALILDKEGVRISKNSIRRGIKSVRWKGRFDIRRLRGKIVVFDGAHNPHGSKALVSSLSSLFPEEKVSFVFGVMRDKRYERMLESLSRVAGRFIFTSVGTERALPVCDLLKVGGLTFKSEKIALEGSEDPLDALERALSYPEKIVCVCGSLYLVGKILEVIEGKGEN